MSRMCCSLSDELCFHLSTRRHERYSEAQLNHRELSDRLVGGLVDNIINNYFYFLYLNLFFFFSFFWTELVKKQLNLK